MFSFMDDNKFGNIIQEAIRELPDEFRQKIDNVVIVITETPTEDQMKMFAVRGEKRLLLGLYQGTPQTKRRNYGVCPTLPDKITIFKIPLLQISNSFDNAVENIKETVIHEIAHHFGMTDKDIHKAKSKSS